MLGVLEKNNVPIKCTARLSSEYGGCCYILLLIPILPINMGMASDGGGDRSLGRCGPSNLILKFMDYNYQ
jgi:hypothetical protein